MRSPSAIPRVGGCSAPCISGAERDRRVIASPAPGKSQKRSTCEVTPMPPTPSQTRVTRNLAHRRHAILSLPSIALLLLLATALSSLPAWAQGCILARSPEQTGLPTEEGGVLEPGHLQLTIGLRHQYSYQHYVGDVYQEH